MSIRLRSYQRDCVEYFHSAWRAGHVRVPAVLSTGAGKTVIFTHPSFVEPFLKDGKRVLIVAHTDELIEQAAKKARLNNPKRRVGVVKASLNQATAEIVVSSRQTLAHATGGPRRLAQLRNVGLIIIDEAHHCLRTNSYGKVLDYFGCFGQDAADVPSVAGFTATLARGDKEKLSTVWETPVIDGKAEIFRKDILYFIRRGFLLDVRGQRVVVPDMDLRNIKQAAGDYQADSVADELERTFAPEVVAKRYAEVAVSKRTGQLRKGIAFWPLVDTAEHGARAFNEQGIRSEVIHGALDKTTRRAMLQRLHTGETTVVHGVAVLTEGFDEPTCDVVVLGRPTRSAPLYQQMVGRVLRPDLTISAEERERALILDVVGAGATHDLRSLVDLAPERPRKEQPAEDLSLLQIEEEWLLEQQEIAGSGTPHFTTDYDGETVVVEFDPLGRDKLWQQTEGGTYFMAAGGSAFAFLVASLEGDPGTWDVVLCSNAARGQEAWARGTEFRGLPLDLALAEAEDAAVEHGGHGALTLSGRKSAWRKGEPTPVARSKAWRMGVWREGMTAGECSEAIDRHKASIRIDPMVEFIKRSGESK